MDTPSQKNEVLERSSTSSYANHQGLSRSMSTDSSSFSSDTRVCAEFQQQQEMRQRKLHSHAGKGLPFLQMNLDANNNPCNGPMIVQWQPPLNGRYPRQTPIVRHAHTDMREKIRNSGLAMQLFPEPQVPSKVVTICYYAPIELNRFANAINMLLEFDLLERLSPRRISLPQLTSTIDKHKVHT